MEMWLVFIVIGLIAGFTSGLIGIGGGVIVVPALAYIFARQPIPHEFVMHAATASSLTIMVLTTLVAAISHHRHEPIRWSLYWHLFPGLVVGACSGVVVAHFLDSNVLRIIFAVFLLLVAIKIFFFHTAKPDGRLPGRVGLSFAAYGIGTAASLLGIGGSIFMTPYLLHHHITVRQTVVVAVTSSFTIALIGAIVSIITGFSVVGMPAWSSGYIFWPAVIGITLPSVASVSFGAWVSHKMNTDLLQYIFATLLVLISCHLILSVWH